MLAFDLVKENQASGGGLLTVLVAIYLICIGERSVSFRLRVQLAYKAVTPLPANVLQGLVYFRPGELINYLVKLFTSCHPRRLYTLTPLVS
jgi:hypothetical protein